MAGSPEDDAYEELQRQVQDEIDRVLDPDDEESTRHWGFGGGSTKEEKNRGRN